MPTSKLTHMVKKKLDKLFGRASFVSRKRLVILTVILIAVIIAFVIISLRSTVDRISVEQEEDQITVIDQSNRHPYTGAILENDLEAVPQLFAVMVENAADAWPLSGVEDSFLVIEAPVEGDIPRFVTYFSEESDVAKIGPVRSARPYYVEWNTPMNAPYAHVGGSPEALDLIGQTSGFIDINQFYQSEYFWRQTTGGRYAPHNVYTSTELLTDALDELDVDKTAIRLFSYKDDAPTEEAPKSVEIDWTSGSLYDISWDYSSEENNYIRTQGGVTYIANNIIIMETDVSVIDDVGRKSLETVGKGDVMIVQDGEVFFGTWEKSSQQEPLRFYTNSGDEISMNAGATWIEVVSSLTKVSISEVE